MDVDHLSRLLEDYGAVLELYAAQWCRSPEDAVQVAFIELAAERAWPTNPVAWLFRAVRCRAISRARSMQRRKHHESQVSFPADRWFEPSPSDRLDADAAEQALRTLPIEQREVIIARLWGQTTFGEIAELLGSSSSAVHRAYVAGLAALRTRMGIEEGWQTNGRRFPNPGRTQ